MSRILALTLVVALAAGCASVESNVRVGGLDERIRAEWDVDAPAQAPAERRITGYIYNTYNLHADRMRLLVEALDAGGQVVDRRWQWVPGGVPPNNRTYFEVRKLPVAADYRVSVPYFTWTEGPGGGFFRIRF